MSSTHEECPECTSDQWTFCDTSHRRKDNRSTLRCTRCWFEAPVVIGKIQYPLPNYKLRRIENGIGYVVTADPPDDCEWVSTWRGCYGAMADQRNWLVEEGQTPPWYELEEWVREKISEGYIQITMEK